MEWQEEPFGCRLEGKGLSLGRSSGACSGLDMEQARPGDSSSVFLVSFWSHCITRSSDWAVFSGSASRLADGSSGPEDWGHLVRLLSRVRTARRECSPGGQTGSSYWRSYGGPGGAGSGVPLGDRTSGSRHRQTTPSVEQR